MPYCQFQLINYNGEQLGMMLHSPFFLAIYSYILSKALYSAYKKEDKFENFWPECPEWRIRIKHYSNMTLFGVFLPKVFKFPLFYRQYK